MSLLARIKNQTFAFELFPLVPDQGRSRHGGTQLSPLVAYENRSRNLRAYARRSVAALSD